MMFRNGFEIMKLMTIIQFRIKAMTGGIKTLIFLLVALSLCFFIASAIITVPVTRSLNIAVVDFDESYQSLELVEQLQSLSGIEVSVKNLQEAQTLLARGNIDGILTIGMGYADALRSDTRLPLTYDSSPDATTQMTAREIIAGQVVAARSLARAHTQLEEEGVHVDPYEIAALIAKFNENTSPLYQFSVHGANEDEGQHDDKIFAGYVGFVSLVIILVMMTLSQWFSQPDSKKVVTRLTSTHKGRQLSYFSDMLLLLILGGAIITLAYISFLNLISPSLFELIYLLIYVYCVTGICLALSKLQESGSMDVMAPMIALSTSILGGSFANLDSLVPALRTVAYFTPQGQMLHGIEYGVLWPMLVLVLAGSIFLYVGYPRTNK